MVSPREIPKPERPSLRRNKVIPVKKQLKIRIGRQPAREGTKIKKMEVPALLAPPNHPILTKAIEKYVKKKATCCDILYVHHEALKDDPHRLTTEFIRSFSKCRCG